MRFAFSPCALLGEDSVVNPPRCAGAMCGTYRHGRSVFKVRERLGARNARLVSEQIGDRRVERVRNRHSLRD